MLQDNLYIHASEQFDIKKWSVMKKCPGSSFFVLISTVLLFLANSYIKIIQKNALMFSGPMCENMSDISKLHGFVKI